MPPSERRPDYLKPVPAPGSAAAAAEAAEHVTDGTPGLTPPVRQGHSGMFITDVIVELGYASAERVEQSIDEARVAGRSPEDVLLENNVVDGDQLSRAVAERYGLDHVDLNTYRVDMAAANLLLKIRAGITSVAEVARVST